jgi:hypothetical protein
MSTTKKIYYTLDNGGRPFKVVVGKTSVQVYKRGRSDLWEYDSSDYDPLDPSDYDSLNYLDPSDYDTLIMRLPRVKKVFVGKDVEDSSRDGNSILLSMAHHRYVFIGDNIYEFSTPDKDVITHYYSEVGNSEVPYPVAVGKQNAYFMTGPNGGKACYVPRTMFHEDTDFTDAYSEFYDRNRPGSDFAKSVKTVPHYKEIHKRLW